MTIVDPIRSRCQKNEAAQVIQKGFKVGPQMCVVVAFGVQMWSKMELKIRIVLMFSVFLAQSGPTGLSGWILRAKMERKRPKWEANVDPMAST